MTVSPARSLPQLRTPRSYSTVSRRPSGAKHSWPGRMVAVTGVAGPSATVQCGRPSATTTSPGPRATAGARSGNAQGVPATTAVRLNGTSSAIRMAHGEPIRQRTRKAPRARGPSSTAERPSTGAERRRSRMSVRAGAMSPYAGRGWTGGMTLRSLVLVLATVAAGLQAGTYYVWACGVMPGLARVDDKTFVTALTQMNQAIVNPVFMLSFLGAPLLAGVALLTGGPGRG